MTDRRRARPRDEALLINRRPRFGIENSGPNNRYSNFCFWHYTDRRNEYEPYIILGRIEQIKQEAE